MTRFLSSTALGVLMCFSSSAGADAPWVRCECTQGGWCGPGHYAYVIDSASYPMIEFTVGTNDLEAAHYLNVTIPPGWNFAVEQEGISHAGGLFAYHGSYSEGPDYSPTPGRLRWWTDDPAYAIEFFTFAFDHPWRAEDVGWQLATRREGPPPEYYTFSESWYEQVGMAYGPLHGPWGPVDFCSEDEECGEDGYCHFPDCVAETGVCMPRPYNCPWLWDPVCGCDGQTYANACIAALYGVRLAYHDECLVGDLDLDGGVDLADLGALLSAFGTCEGEPGYFPAADIDDSGCIDLSDLATLLSNYGTEI